MVFPGHGSIDTETCLAFLHGKAWYVWHGLVLVRIWHGTLGFFFFLPISCFLFRFAKRGNDLPLQLATDRANPTQSIAQKSSQDDDISCVYSIISFAPSSVTVQQANTEEDPGGVSQKRELPPMLWIPLEG